MTNPIRQSAQKTLQQQRAYAAWQQVHSVPGEYRPDYIRVVRGAPATILRDGFAPTLAFFNAKGGREHKAMIRHLTGWMQSRLDLLQDKDLIEYLVECNSAQYRQATTEALAYLMWLKRFAEALDVDSD